VITQEREDYLKTIYTLQAEEKPVRTNSIARALEVEPASVTGVIKKLSDIHLVEYEPYKGVILTPAGEKIALEVIRHHRLIELYLIQALGYSWDEVHEEAERLEHVVSDLFEERIVAVLGHPTTDPHGAPIPTKDGYIKETEGFSLDEISPGQSGIVTEVSDSNPELLRYLAEMGIRPSVRVTVNDVAPFSGPITLMVGDEQRTLGREAARSIVVRLEKD
jgi:DtxR family transcriptional regulator, Mn-dependent transcriptional regulator